MKRLPLVFVVALLSAACGSSNDQAREADTAATTAAAAGTTSAPAATSPTSPSSSAISDADRAAILKTLELTADAKGQVLNECGDRVTPQLFSVDVGKAVGTAVLVAMSGGPSLATCYGDGPGLTLMRQFDGRWTQIYSSRGGSLAILKETHNGAQDLVFAGPGFSHPLFTWNGTTYVRADSEVPDDKIGNAVFLP